jgi:hypothetical protein
VLQEDEALHSHQRVVQRLLPLTVASNGGGRGPSILLWLHRRRRCTILRLAWLRQLGRRLLPTPRRRAATGPGGDRRLTLCRRGGARAALLLRPLRRGRRRPPRRPFPGIPPPRLRRRRRGGRAAAAWWAPAAGASVPPGAACGLARHGCRPPPGHLRRGPFGPRRGGRGRGLGRHLRLLVARRPGTRRTHRPTRPAAATTTTILRPSSAKLRIGPRLPCFFPRRRRSHAPRTRPRLGLRGLREDLLHRLLLRRGRRRVARLRPTPGNFPSRRARRLVALLADAATHCLPTASCFLLLAEAIRTFPAIWWCWEKKSGDWTKPRGGECGSGVLGFPPLRFELREEQSSCGGRPGVKSAEPVTTTGQRLFSL